MHRGWSWGVVFLLFHLIFLCMVFSLGALGFFHLKSFSIQWFRSLISDAVFGEDELNFTFSTCFALSCLLCVSDLFLRLDVVPFVCLTQLCAMYSEDQGYGRGERLSARVQRNSCSCDKPAAEAVQGSF
jgi:hypothetical protein